MIDLALPVEAVPEPPPPTAARLFCVGISHRRASLEIRERLAIRPETELQLTRALHALPGLAEHFLLSTCNRLELYGVAHSLQDVTQARAVFGCAIGLGEPQLNQWGDTWRDEDAIRHLLEVAVGVDSQLVGETEIFGQVKRAYEKAQRCGTTGRVLNQLAQRSFHLAKEIRTATSISAGHLSLGSQVAEASVRKFGDLTQARILVIGCGEIGRKVARAFHSRGARSLTLCNRTPERVERLSIELAAMVLPFGLREERLADFDLVVASTGAHGFILSAAAVGAALDCRAGRPMALFDLAMPRNIEPVALAGMTLSNLETLSLGAEASQRGRLQAAGLCRGLIKSRSGVLWQRLGSVVRSASPLRDLRARQ